MKIQNLIENIGDHQEQSSTTSQHVNSKHFKEIKEYLVKKEQQQQQQQRIGGSTADTVKVKLRNKTKTNHLPTCSFSVWRSSPSLNCDNGNLDDAKLDLDKIENDLN